MTIPDYVAIVVLAATKRQIGKRTMKTLLAGVAFAIAVAFSSQASAFPYCTKITWHGNYYVCTIDEAAGSDEGGMFS